MSEFEIELGEIDVLIMGVHLSLRRQTDEQKILVANSIAEILAQRLNEKFEGIFNFEIVSVESGCIKVKLRLFWKGVGELLTPPALIITILAGAHTLWAADEKKTVFTASGIKCEAKYSGGNLIKGCHVTVHEGESLSEIVNTYDYRRFTLNQVIVATFLKNKDQFIDGNMNKLPVGVMLVLPKPSEISIVSDAYAISVIQIHNKSNHADS